MDPIADFLTQIRNAYLARHDSLSSPYSKIKESIAKLLSEAGFIGEVTVQGAVPKKRLNVNLIYQGKYPVLTHISRLSTPSVRYYVTASKLRSPLGGRGITIISTSRGLMTDRQAKKLGLGGEKVCQVW